MIITRPAGHRRTCPEGIRHYLLTQQEYRCAYCQFRFGSVIIKPGRVEHLSVVEYDHFIPFAYCQTNSKDNWIAACRTCNAIKGSTIYPTLGEAMEDIIDEWVWRKYYCDWEPSVSSEAPYPQREQWSKEYATYLASLGSRRKIR